MPSDSLASAGRAAHDLGAAALLGGNLFARTGMHPALAEISDPSERGRVLNRAWRRYGAVNGASLVAVIAGWAAARAEEASPRWPSAPERALARAEDASVLAVALTGMAAAVSGVRFAAMEPGGAVALRDGDHALAGAPASEARLKRVLSGLGSLNLAACASLIAINAGLAQAGFRRPAARGLLSRRL